MKGCGSVSAVRVFTATLGACASVAALGCDTGAPRDTIERLDGVAMPIDSVLASVEGILASADVAGLSLAVVQDGAVVHVAGLGSKDTDTGEPMGTETVVAAASFSKTVFGYLVMLLVEEGTIDLDRPLEEYLGFSLPEDPHYADLADDPRTADLTARMVLSHSTGFPNWRWIEDDGRLRFLFDPGSRFFYSGEGIALLQRVVEETTGRGLEDLARERVFGPLGMARTSYIWQESFESDHAVPHDEFLRPRHLDRRDEAGAAGSMFTTAGDYARFLASLMTAESDGRALVDAMWSPQVAIRSERMFGPRAWDLTDANDAMALSWSLGWGRFDSEHGRGLFHTGHDTGWQNYAVAFPDRGIALVMMSNSDNFESVAEELAGVVIGDRVSPFTWLGYVPFDPARPRPEPPPGTQPDS